ncbi:MAG: hypothetical protein E7069_10415 [Bacteroidales bacterium]|nr:hypothetical protein [Bacteroidales bacterium]
MAKIFHTFGVMHSHKVARHPLFSVASRYGKGKSKAPALPQGNRRLRQAQPTISSKVLGMFRYAQHDNKIYDLSDFKSDNTKRRISNPTKQFFLPRPLAELVEAQYV